MGMPVAKCFQKRNGHGFEVAAAEQAVKSGNNRSGVALPKQRNALIEIEIGQNRFHFGAQGAVPDHNQLRCGKLIGNLLESANGPYRILLRLHAPDKADDDSVIVYLQVFSSLFHV